MIFFISEHGRTNADPLEFGKRNSVNVNVNFTSARNHSGHGSGIPILQRLFLETWLTLELMSTARLPPAAATKSRLTLPLTELSTLINMSMYSNSNGLIDHFGYFAMFCE